MEHIDNCSSAGLQCNSTAGVCVCVQAVILMDVAFIEMLP